MRTLLLTVVAAAWCLGPAPAQVPKDEERKAAEEALFKELSAGLPQDSQRARSARLELEYWHKHSWKTMQRKTTKAKDGTEVEVVFLGTFETSLPSTGFSMA